MRLATLLCICLSWVVTCDALLAQPVSGFHSGEAVNASSGPDAQVVRQTIRSRTQHLAAQVAQLLDERVGWLRPTSTKEQALCWVAFSAAIPWFFFGLTRPLAQSRFGLLRFLVVCLWLAVAVWLGWRIWGLQTGMDQFVSTMLVAVPALWLYFTTVVRVLAPVSEKIG